jgi:hypothetical protein
LEYPHPHIKLTTTTTWSLSHFAFSRKNFGPPSTTPPSKKFDQWAVFFQCISYS